MDLKSQIQFNLDELYKKIERATHRSLRKFEDVNLIAVTKYQSLEALKILYSLGVREFGENRIQEALEKIENLPKDINWHLIGTLQKNKVVKALNSFKLIHSVDSLDLALKIGMTSETLGLITPILLQVNISEELTKHGFRKDEVYQNFEKLNSIPGIAIKGLMTMAPLKSDEKALRATFSGLRSLKDELNRQVQNNPLEILSMGMSQDFEVAIEEGATHLRIGSYLFRK